MRHREEPSHHGIKESRNDRYPNETLKLLIERASCRSFEDKRIPDEILRLILEAGIHAPTGGNLQPFSIIKIQSDESKKKIAQMCQQDFIAKAPVDLLFCIDWHRLKRWAELEVAPFTGTSAFRNFWISFQDTIVAAQNICTAADSLGLGSVYIGTIMGFMRETRDMFQLPEGVLPVVLLCLGYPKEKPSPRKKLAVDVIVQDEKYYEKEDSELIKAFDNKYPGMRWKITEERLVRIAQACRRVHGEEFAGRCLSKIKENGYINPVQIYFGLHYCADEMAQGNDTFLEIIEELGFDWFRKYEPPKEAIQ
jgi:FMN reductase [NAD(P)H]